MSNCHDPEEYLLRNCPPEFQDALAKSELAAQAGSVFEIVDATNEESYWTLGMWPTLSEAMSVLEMCKDPNDLGCPDRDEDDECCVIEVRERKFGWSGSGKKVAGVSWNHTYNGADDTYQWVKTQNAEPRHSR